eukprot:TRINITY_DN12019_c0_g1_i1.p1 TRINITY_DN12019_c0_g1~~TRINITY_DN12019_c0_g1_i1.p1  ORF type:complete len:751 (-),score=137.97 TRINITY_DN12019_c0_g1_i1:336-2588(-)
MALKLGLAGYTEISSLTPTNVTETFSEGVRIALNSVEGFRFLQPNPPPKPPCPVSQSELLEVESNETAMWNNICRKIRNNLSMSLKKSTCSDIVIHHPGGDIFAHKIILACGSHVFNRLLVHGECIPTLFANHVEEKCNHKRGFLHHAKVSDGVHSVWEMRERILPDHPLPDHGRYGHTCFKYKNCIFTIGGVNHVGGYITDMLCFDTEHFRWKSAIPHSGIGGKDFPIGNFHSSVTVGHDVLVFGGKSNTYSNTLWQLHLEDFSWRKVSAMGPLPDGVYGHSAVLRKNKMYVFGGYNNCFGLSSDLYCYDLSNNRWEFIPPCKDSPIPVVRHSHFASLIGGDADEADHMIIFGGRGKLGILNDTWLYDFNTNTWREIITLGAGPRVRYGFSTLVNGNELVVFGGFDGSVVCDDVWSFGLDDVDNSQWREVRPLDNNKSFLGRYHHTVCSIGDGTEIVIIGGRSTDESLCPYAETGKRSTESHKGMEGKNISEIWINSDTLSYEVTCSWLESIYAGVASPLVSSSSAFSSDEIFSHTKYMQTVKELAFHQECLFEDVFFSTNDGKQFPGHKVIFESNSGFFETFLESIQKLSSGKEHGKEIPEIPLPLLTAKEFKFVSSFLYCAPFHLNRDNVFDTLVMANKFMLEPLETCCEYWIMSHIKEFDVVVTLEFANTINATRLSTFLLWYMRVNYSPLLIERCYQSKVLNEGMIRMIEENQWPGRSYFDHVEHLQRIIIEENNKTENSNCVLQ